MKSMGEKIRASEYLLDEIGNVDDKLLEEAASYKKKRTSPRVLLAAACFVLTLTLVLSAGIAMKMSNEANDSLKDTENSDTYYGALDSLLLSHKDGEFTKLSDESEIPYRTGKAYVVWQYAGESEIYLSDALTDAQLRNVTKHLGMGENVGQTPPHLECRVWIVLDSGEVKSPYLKDTDGNTGAEIFDYNAEIYPTSDFINSISAIIN